MDLVTIHPFGDGNGEIARVIADMALARKRLLQACFDEREINNSECAKLDVGMFCLTLRY